jgi:hypothetical protein
LHHRAFAAGADEEFKFFFKCIDPTDHEREFLVAVRVMDEVRRCRLTLSNQVEGAWNCTLETKT